ncbi:MAG: hypothetical protein FWG28_05210 [Clostridiales bacterium]|nr:hypothetical protein [Clostridiales bacterium]
MDIKPVMSRFGFGHRETNHIIIEHDGELWLAGAPMVVGGFLNMGGSGLPGALKVEPLVNGEPVLFTYTATEALLELTTEKGATVRFAMDKGAKALRVAGDTAIRFNAVKDAAGTSGLNKPEGTVVSAGGSRYLFAAGKGSVSCDTSWMIHKRHGVAPVVYVEPEGGGFELYIFDLPDDTDAPAITKTLDECAAAGGADFQEFMGGLVDIPAEWGGLKAKLAYPLWLCHRVLDGQNEVVVQNKYNSRYTTNVLMSIASMAFKDAAKAVDMILSCPMDLPPVAAVAITRLYDSDMLNDSRGEIYRIYHALEAVVRKCMKERTADEDGLAFYAYRFESGLERSPEYFKAGEPALAPDLNAYLVLAAEVMSKLTHLEYDVAAGRKWEAYAKRLKALLIAELWDGEDFIGKNAYSGEVSGPDKFLSLVPIILGERLPGEIVRKLAAKFGQDASDSAVGLMLAGGLYDAGEKAAAKDIIEKALARTDAEGVACPFYAAALIAAAHKVL